MGGAQAVGRIFLLCLMTNWREQPSNEAREKIYALKKDDDSPGNYYLAGGGRDLRSERLETSIEPASLRRKYRRIRDLSGGASAARPENRGAAYGAADRDEKRRDGDAGVSGIALRELTAKPASRRAASA